MPDWISAIAQALAKVSELGTVVAENQGQKIPMKEEAIRARAKYHAERIEFRSQIKVFEAKQIRKWKNDFEINKDKFSLIQEGAVKNMIERLVRSGKVIYQIELRTKEERYYACIRYVDNDDCQTWVEVYGKRV